MDIRFIPEAKQDLKETLDEYFSIDEKLKKKFLASLENSFIKIRKLSKLYPFESKTSQKALMDKFPYMILYEVYDDSIIILAIFHTRRDSKKLTNRKNKQ